MGIDIYNEDCIEALVNMDDECIDSVVTDPPAGISFMNKSWDDDKGGRDAWISWMSSVMKECLRVMKPGAHGFVWALPRTSHWTATACENAGFEVRDVVTHLFGSGFPKSMDISKAIDKQAGAQRAVLGLNANHRKLRETRCMVGEPHSGDGSITAPSTDLAKKWRGWGTALKPASEHWILVRKPCSEKTVAANVIKHGCGGINIDASRIEGGKRHPGNYVGASFGGRTTGTFGEDDRSKFDATQGRFPANLILDEEAGAMLDEQSGISKSPSTYKRNVAGKGVQGWGEDAGKVSLNFGDSGGASRFFYCPKTSKSERNAGLEDSAQTLLKHESRPCDWERAEWSKVNKNYHPTVKPVKLMEYLIRLITPKGGVVLDPFMGSGSTGLAAKNLGFGFVGIEKEAEYFEIARERIAP